MSLMDMASKQSELDQADPYHVGYDQPGDPPAFASQSQAYTYPMSNTQNTTSIIVPKSQMLLHRPPLSNWTTPAILSCLCCFWPTGICAIVAAVHARSSYYSGDYEAERIGTSWAKWLTITSVCLGFASVVVFIIYFFAVVERKYNVIHLH